MYLNCHTYFSLRYGTIPPKELLEMAAKEGITQLAVTDINNTSACLEMMRLAPEYNINPVIGVDFRNGAEQQFILLAKNNTGFQKINEYLSGFLHDDTQTIPDRAPYIPESFVIYPFEKGKDYLLRDNEFLGVRPEEVNKLKFSPWQHRLGKLVALQTVSFQNKKGFNTHRLLRAIANNTLLSKLNEVTQGRETDRLVPVEELQHRFAEFPQLLTNACSILDVCNVSFDFSQTEPQNQKCFTDSEAEDMELLRSLIAEGIPYRYGEHPDAQITARIAKELEIIQQKGFVSYFLINWSILKYARSKGYFYVGRGSGANSIIAYILRITDVDPVELDLYFERFINLYRKNPPDFDIDFSWADRDDITRFIFENFKQTALITVYNTFKFRASVRELGKVFGLPKTEIDRLTTGKFVVDELDKLSLLVVKYATYIEGFPNYLGIHAGGIVISQKPIHYYCATFLPPKGFPTTQIDMVSAEDIGLYKFDILSQRGLGKIKDSVAIIADNHPELPPIDIHDMKRFKEDERIKDLLRNAKAIGCFYVESPAMRMLLKKLQVDNYLGLVAASSVIRPGVAKSGMMREYILRYRYPERRNDGHPVLQEIMPETYGVMVYQEDVIKVAHYFGGLTLGEADMLRRGMSGKFRSRDEFMKVKQQFFDNCKAAGKEEKMTEEVWRQIESFAGYAFAKGHSASYAVESYQSLFLKAYFPLEYMVATINNGGGFYSMELYVHEARMHGATIEPPCINTSTALTLIKGTTIYIGLGFVHALEAHTVTKILYARNKNGAFTGLDDFIDRVPISVEQLAILIKINAFRFTGTPKRQLLWDARLKAGKEVPDEHIIPLFKQERVHYQYPELTHTALEDAFDEIELLGFPLCNPFLLVEKPRVSLLKANDLPKYRDTVVTIEGYLVTTKNTSTSKGKRMQFGTFIDYNGDFIDTVHFPPVAAQYPFRGRGVYSITGKVVEEFDCMTIEVISMYRKATIEDPRYSDAGIRLKA